MSLRFIYGRAGCGKSYYCYNEIKSMVDRGEKRHLVLLVPEQFSLQAEKKLINVLGTGGILRTEVLSFKRMTYRVFNEVGGIANSKINSAGKCMLISRILQNFADEFKILAKPAIQQGFVNKISDMITEFKRCDVSPDDLEKAYLAICENSVENSSNYNSGSMLREKLKEIILLYREYEKALQDKYIDGDDELTLLYKKLDISSLFDGSEIWIDEFSGFTEQEYKIIGKLMKKAYRVNVCLCTDCLVDDIPWNLRDSYTDVFSPVKNVYRKLVKIAAEYNVHVEPPVAVEKCNWGNGSESYRPYRFKDSRELDHLEKHFFSFPYKQYADPDCPGRKTSNISIFIASSIYTEIEHTAESIIKLCRDKGFRYRDITVVCGNLNMYEKFISAIFTEYGIPFFIDRKKEITRHPLVKLIISLFEIFIYGWSYEAVFGYLKTGLTGIDREDIDLIENYVLACGIKGNRWTKNEDWEYVPEALWNSGDDEKNRAMMIKINDIRKKITGPLLEFHSRASGRKTGREICTALYDLLCRLEVPQRIEMYIDRFKKEGELSYAGEYGQIWNIIVEVLDQAVELLGNERIGLERFLEILKIGFSEYKTSLIPPALDQVLVGDIERSKNRDIKALYILGVNDGVFPAPINEEGLFNDRDIIYLQDAGIQLTGDSRTRTVEQQYMIYSVLTSAEKYLTLSVPVADIEGRSLRPSIVISRLRKIFPNIMETSNITCQSNEDEELELVSSCVPTYNRLLSMMRKAADGAGIKPLWSDVYLWYANHDEWQDKCNTLISALTYTNLAEPIEKEKVRKLYGSPMYSNVSRFERYAECPFAYYIQYGLKAKERKIFSLTPPDIGTYLHRAIEEFSKLVKEKGISWDEIDREWCKNAISEISDNLLESMQGGLIKNGTKRYRVLVKRLNRMLLRAVWLMIEQIKRSSFEPVAYEIEFGGKGGLPPINIELPSGEVIKLTGRIDRVDAFGDSDGTYIRIIDYKSGNRDFSLTNVYYGLQIQLVAYLSALWEEKRIITDKLSDKMKLPVKPGGILYFKIDDPMIRNKKELTDEEIEKAIMKELKMRGLVLADVKVIRHMDKTINGDSLIIPVRINNGDVIGKNSSVATLEQFNTICRYVKRILQELGSEMLEGNISISPYKYKNMTSCNYCEYSSICQFEPAFRDNKYRIIIDKSDDELWKMMNDYCRNEEGQGEEHKSQ